MNPSTPFASIRYRALLLFLAAGMLFSGCTLSGIDKNADSEITEQDLQAAGQIIGESLSDDNSGVMASMNDVFTSFSDNGFVLKSPSKTTSGANTDDDNSGRGSETNYSYTYDPETGMHTITFMRSVFEADFEKTVTDTLKYIFTDFQDEFIAYPRAEKERIETIDFKGHREGTINSPRKNSFFIRKDTFLVDGISAATQFLHIDGIHNGRGNMEVTTEDGNQLERSYELTIDFLNIEIDKSLVDANQTLEQGVTGSVSWEMTITKSRNGSSETKTIRGTVEFNGDGTALLRFTKFAKLFHINLDDGNVSDHSNEFEGRVTRVNLEHDRFALKSGLIVQTNPETEFDPSGDLYSLESMASALENGLLVWSEGRGRKDGDVFIASRLRIETREHDDSRVEFEDATESVSVEDSVVTLDNGKRILITGDTVIDDSGDLHSLGAVKDALEQGSLVITAGKGHTSDRNDIDVVAVRIRFDEEDSL